MPLSKPTLVLETSPRSVSEARRWAAEACRGLGREDLVDSAELGVSELVTNAVLHGAPPIGLRMRGTRSHPRIEVLDGSVKPPQPNPRMTHDDELLATFGRGLALVAMCSTQWGAYVLDDGKIVWFEPTAEPDPEADVSDAQIYESVSPATGSVPKVPLDSAVEVRLENLPIELYVHWLRHFREIRREVVLLSLSHSAAYPVAATLSDLFVRFDQEVQRVRGLSRIQAAIDRGLASATVSLLVDSSASAKCAQMLEVLEIADAFCRNEQLLSLATSPQQQDFQRWYLREYVRQGQGEPPTPWSGQLTLDPTHEPE